MAKTDLYQKSYYRLGLVFCVLCIQYYVAQVLVASRFKDNFSWLHNTISDLGNTVCGPYGIRTVCSPLHSTMNASFLLLGISMIAGSCLIARSMRQPRLAQIGFICIALAGAGTILVGLFPENTVSAMHVTGAGMAFVLGNIALLLFSYSLPLPAAFRYITRLAGSVALVALVFFMRQNYLGLDIGGMERIVAYPQSIWLILYGLFRSKQRV